ncbi:hypothetical protein K0M31_013801, partial [Melipona bicolor]
TDRNRSIRQRSPRRICHVFHDNRNPALPYHRQPLQRGSRAAVIELRNDRGLRAQAGFRWVGLDRVELVTVVG